LLKKQNAIQAELAGMLCNAIDDNIDRQILIWTIDGIQRYRHTLKLIREKEQNLTVARDKKRHFESKQGGSHRSGSKGKGTDVSRELSSLEQECRSQEEDLADFKRFAIREAFYVRFNALTEYAEKLAMVAGFGKYLVDQISIEPTPHGQPRKPYAGRDQTSTIIEDAFAAIDAWRPSEQDERPTVEIPDRHSSIDVKRPASFSQHSSGDDNDSNSFVESPAMETHPPPLPARPKRAPSRPSPPPLPPHPNDMPPAYHESTKAHPAPSVPEAHTDFTEATEYSTPYQAHAQSYQHPNEAESSPVLHYLSSDQTANYNQLYRHVSRTQHHAQRPYSEYRAQQQQRLGAGGFRLPTQPSTVASAEEEKRQLAEQERMEEAVGRNTSPGIPGSSAPPYWSMPPPVHDQPYQPIPNGESRHSYSSSTSSDHPRPPSNQHEPAPEQPPQYYH
jgi:hypothetical protein